MSHKKMIRKALEFIIFSSIHISIAALLWGLITFILIDEPINLYPLIIIFLMTYFVYTLNRVGGEDEDKINYPERVKFSSRYKKILLPIAIIGYIFGFILSLNLNLTVTFFTLLPIFSFFIYRIFKKFTIVKNIIIGFVWASSVLLIGASTRIFNEIIFSFFCFVFLRDFSNSIFFDIRDVNGDKKAGIKTIPIILGIKKTLLLLNIINIFSGILLLFLIFFNYLPQKAITLLGLIFYNIFYYNLYKKGNVDKFFLFDVIADSEIYFATFLILIGDVWL